MAGRTQTPAPSPTTSKTRLFVILDTAHSLLRVYGQISESETLYPETRRPPMRTFFDFGIITVLAVTFWFGGHTIAKQNVEVSMDPYWMTTNAPDLPTAPVWDLY